jgi:microcin C transport system substrate-binding protein
MLYNILIFITFSFIFAPIALAEDTQAKSAALAMHGTDKYGPHNAHIDYANPDAPKGGHLKMAAIGTFDSLNPYILKGSAAQGLNLVYDKLMARRWDEPFTMYPQIAKSYEMPEDRSSITFVIDRRAQFSDASPLTAADVQFSFETLREFGRPNMRRIYKLVKDVTINDNAITFTFGEGADRETPMILSMMPILSKTYWSARTFDSTTLDIPLTNGPYRIKEIDAGRSITYERNPDYWAKDLFANVGHYNIDLITYDYFRDDTVALEAFNKGDLNYRFERDIAKWNSAYSDAPNIVKYEAHHKRPERVRAMIFNTRRAPFDDIKVREALNLAFDEEWIGKNIYYGTQKRIDSIFPNSPLAAPQEAKEPQNHRQRLRTASALLRDAGWNIENGALSKDGTPFTFELTLSAPEEEKIALNFKKHLERLGISMNIRVLDSAAFQKRRQDYDFDMILHHWQNSLSPGTEQTLYWSCESANQSGRFNYSGVCNEQIESLARQIADAKTYDELTTLAHALDRALLEKHLMIPLFYSGIDKIAHDATLKHTNNVPIYGSVTETWWMDTDKP